MIIIYMHIHMMICPMGAISLGIEVSIPFLQACDDQGVILVLGPHLTEEESTAIGLF